MPPERQPGRVLGAVLAGGASSRFGSDKAAAAWGGRSLLDHAQAILAAAVDEVVVVGRGRIPDVPIAGLGPLGGIAGALSFAGHNGFASVLTIACDMPELPDGLIAALLVRSPSYCSNAPVLGHWPAALAEGLIERLTLPTPAGEAAELRMPDRVRHDGGGTERHRRSGALSVRRWANDIGALPIASPVPLRNINTPADLLTP